MKFDTAGRYPAALIVDMQTLFASPQAPSGNSDRVPLIAFQNGFLRQIRALQSQ